MVRHYYQVNGALNKFPRNLEWVDLKVNLHNSSLSLYAFTSFYYYNYYLLASLLNYYKAIHDHIYHCGVPQHSKQRGKNLVPSAILLYFTTLRSLKK